LNAPKELIDLLSERWTLLGYKAGSGGLLYVKSKSGLIREVTPREIEGGFLRNGREDPVSQIVRQGPWDCGLASLAMLLSLPLEAVRNKAASLGWLDSPTGISSELLIEVSMSLGFPLSIANSPIEASTPQMLLLPSLNIEGTSHLIFWNGYEMLDPNWGCADRLWWGCEWLPTELCEELVCFHSAQGESSNDAAGGESFPI